MDEPLKVAQNFKNAPQISSEHKRRAAMKEEIEGTPRPDMSQAGKAYVYIDFNGWVGGRKTTDHRIRQI